MSKQIKNAQGQLLGTIESNSDGSQKIFNARGQYLGEYNPDNDNTYNSQGQLIGLGNQLTSLLND